MKLPSNFRYREIDVPTSQLLKYYDSHLKGTKDLRGYLPAIAISDRIDAFVSLSIDEQCEARLYEERTAIEKIGVWLKKELMTKYACARIIQLLRKIEWHQKKIEEMPYTFLQMNIRARESFDINGVYEEMMKYIDEVHSSYECIKKWSLEDDFAKNVFPVVDRILPSFYLMFGLDYTPTSQRIKEEAGGCVSEIIAAIILLGIVALLAMIFAR